MNYGRNDDQSQAAPSMHIGLFASVHLFLTALIGVFSKKRLCGVKKVGFLAEGRGSRQSGKGYVSGIFYSSSNRVATVYNQRTSNH